MLWQFVLAKVRLISILLSFTGLTDCQAARRGTHRQTNRQIERDRKLLDIQRQTDDRVFLCWFDRLTDRQTFWHKNTDRRYSLILLVWQIFMSLFEGTQTDKQTDRERGRKWLDIQRQTDDRVFLCWFDRLSDRQTFLYITSQTDNRVLFYWFRGNTDRQTDR